MTLPPGRPIKGGRLGSAPSEDETNDEGHLIMTTTDCNPAHAADSPATSQGTTINIPWWLVVVTSPVWIPLGLPLFLLFKLYVALRPTATSAYGVLPEWARSLASKAGRRTSEWVAVAVGLAVVCLPVALAGWGVGCLLRSPLDTTASSRSGGGNVDVWVAAMSAVKDDLKNPGTANFPAYSRTYVSDLGGGRHRVRAFVDAQNAMGASVRTEFLCTVRNEADGWRVESLVYGE